MIVFIIFFLICFVIDIYLTFFKKSTSKRFRFAYILISFFIFNVTLGLDAGFSLFISVLHGIANTLVLDLVILHYYDSKKM